MTDQPSTPARAKATSRRRAQPHIQAPGLLVSALHLFALCGMAIAYPLYELLGRNPEFFVAHRADASDIVVFALLLLFVPPLLLWGVEALVRLAGPRPHAYVHALFVVVLFALVGMRAGRLYLHRGVPTVLLAGALGAGLGYAYVRSKSLRDIVGYLALAPVALVLLFFFTSRTQAILSPGAGGQFRGEPVAARTPIIWVIGDEFASPALMDAHHQIDAKRFPHIAALAKQSTWYRNSTTVNDFTTRAVPAILAGVRPNNDALPTVTAYPTTLFTWLGPSYDLNVNEAVTRLCPDSLCKQPKTSLTSRLWHVTKDSSVAYAKAVFPDALTHALPDIGNSWGDFLHKDEAQGDVTAYKTKRENENQADRFESFIASLHKTGRPSLNFLHVLLPHVDLVNLPDAHSYLHPKVYPGLDLTKPGGGVWRGSPSLTSLQLQRYLLQLKYVDREVGRMVDRLTALGLYDKSLIVLTGDHGVSFVPKTPRRTFTEQNAEDVMPQPLIIKAPFQKSGQVSDRNVQTIDILPTVASLLKLKLPFKVDGVSAVSGAAAPPDKLARSATGGTVRRPAAFPDRFRLADRIAQEFPERADRWDLYAYGPHAGLVGSKAPAGTGTGGRLDYPRDFTDVHASERVLPSFVIGSVPDSVRTFAIAVNGVIGAVGDSYDAASGRAHVAAMVPDFLFKDGANEVRLFAVEGASLRPLGP